MHYKDNTYIGRMKSSQRKILHKQTKEEKQKLIFSQI